MNKLKNRFDTHGGHLYARDPYKRIFGSMHEEDQSSEVEKLKNWKFKTQTCVENKKLGLRVWRTM